MPNLLTCVTIAVQMLVLTAALVGWVGVAMSLRFDDQPLDCAHTWTATLGTALFVGLMGWLS